MGFIKKFFLLIGYGFAALISMILLAVVAVALIITKGDFSISPDGVDIKSENAVGVVELYGEILLPDKFVEEFSKQVDNEKIQAVVVRIDSPGGSVGASEELFQTIKDAAEKKPVVCSLGNIAASGGLYAALGCQKIVAHSGSITGSIGVVMMMPQLSSVVEKFGIGVNVIKSGELKDAGSPFRVMTEKDRAVFQDLVNMAYEQFVKIVATSRGLEVEAVKKFADGRIILGEEALRLGLIDEIGGLAKAAKVALELAGKTGEPELIRTEKKKGLAKLLDRGIEGASLVNWLRGFSEFRLFYRSGF